MSLVQCPECGREQVSDTAEACPNCGFGIKEYFETKNHPYYVMRYLEDDATKYRIVVMGFCDTDTAAYAGINEVLRMDLSYEEAMDVFANSPSIASVYDSKSEAVDIAEQFERWGIEVYVMCPDGSKEMFQLDGLSVPYEAVDMGVGEELVVDRMLKIMCFLIPLIGLVVFCMNVSKSPKGAKTCLMYSAAGLLTGIIIFGLAAADNAVII